MAFNATLKERQLAALGGQVVGVVVQPDGNNDPHVVVTATRSVIYGSAEWATALQERLSDRRDFRSVRSFPIRSIIRGLASGKLKRYFPGSAYLTQ